MASTQILPFCTEAAGSGGNRLTPSAYAALTALLAAGVQSGTASSTQVNTTLAQCSFMAAGLANFCVAQGISVPDDGNLTNLVTEIESAIGAYIAANPPAGAIGNLKSANNLSDLGTLATALTNLGFGTTTQSFKIPNAANTSAPFIIKTGQNTISSGTTQSWAFPISFPNQLLSIVGVDIGASTVPMGLNGTTSIYTIELSTAVAKSFNWIAIGN